MIPQWVPGVAARDAVIKGGGRGPSSDDSGCLPGVLSAFGLILIFGGTVSALMERYWDTAGIGYYSLAAAAVVALVAFGIGYRVRGRLRFVAGALFAFLSAAGLYACTVGSGGANLFWDAVVFLMVGLDQIALKSTKH